MAKALLAFGVAAFVVGIVTGDGAGAIAAGFIVVMAIAAMG